MQILIEKLHEKFSTYGKNAKEWMQKCILMLPEIARNRVWEKKGFSDIYDYARQIAGMSHHKVNEGLRILEKVEDKPELKQIIIEKGINAVRPVITVATKETAKFWAEKARSMSVNSLETYVREIKKLDEERFHMEPKNSRSPHQQAIENSEEMINMSLKKETIKKLQTLKGAGNWEALMQKFLALQEKEMQNLKEKAEKVKAKKVNNNGQNGAATRPISVYVERYIVEKYHQCCAFPGCKKPYEILHHVDRFALKGEHDPERIFPLCKGHERLMHLGLIENEEMGPGYWRVQKNADINDYKRVVDLRVQAFRRGG